MISRFVPFSLSDPLKANWREGNKLDLFLNVNHN